jgi:hypothetical protein
MPRLQARTFATAEDVRPFPNGYTSVLQLDETAVGHGVYEPGWRWADDVIVSSTTRDLLEGSGIRLDDAGEHELKGLPGVRRVFRLAR